MPSRAKHSAPRQCCSVRPFNILPPRGCSSLPLRLETPGADHPSPQPWKKHSQGLSPRMAHPWVLAWDGKHPPAASGSSTASLLAGNSNGVERK